MHNKLESRHPLVGLSDELIRLNGRMRALFAGVRRSEGLSDSEVAVLNAVVEAERPPTVPQIGRSFGQPRQLVQRAANSLIEQGLLEPMPNPDHKRAVLLRATAQGTAIKREMDVRAEEIAAGIGAGIDKDAIRAATTALRAVRKQIEAELRGQ